MRKVLAFGLVTMFACVACESNMIRTKPVETTKPTVSTPAARVETELESGQPEPAVRAPATCELPLLAVAEKIQALKLEYPSKSRPDIPKDQDCSGIFRRALGEFEAVCPIDKPGAKVRSAAALAKWYKSKGRYTKITDPISQSNLIVPGAVMFYSRNGRIFHVGYVVDVTHDDKGVLSYRLMHGRSPGRLAGITGTFHRDPDSAFRSANGKVRPFANWHDPWAGVASIM